jgi:hypothetical protein
MKPDVHVRLCAKIGAGEYDRAIADLLVFYANRRIALPYEFAAPIRAWIRGYAGTDREPVLLRLYDRISPGTSMGSPALSAAQRPMHGASELA